jgi:hypothetical protein
MLARPKSGSVLVAALSAVVAFQPVLVARAEAQAQPRLPYFRWSLGADGKPTGAGPGTENPDAGTNSPLKVSGPEGTYVLRVGKAPNVPAPRATLSPVSWHATGPVPAGLSFGTSDGALVGIPGEKGEFRGIALVAEGVSEDGKPVTGAGKPFTLNVLGFPLALSYDAIAGTVGKAFTLAPNSENVTASATYSLSGDLPPGLAFDVRTGVIAGTPTAAGTTPGIIVTVTDVDGYSVPSPAFSIAVAGVSATNRVLTINQPPQGILNVPFSDEILPKGFVGRIEYGLAAGSGRLPEGIALQGSPVNSVKGIPTETGEFPNIVVVGRDETGVPVAAPAFSISIAQPRLSYAPLKVDVGVPFSLPAQAEHMPSATYRLASGALPDGVSLSEATGAVTGTVYQTGAMSFVVEGSGQSGKYQAEVSLTGVTPPYKVTSPGAFAVAHVGYPLTHAFSAASTAKPVTWEAVGAALPDGLKLDAKTGRVSGVSYAATAVSGAVARATDAAGVTSDSEPVTYQVVALPAIAHQDGYSAPLSRAFRQAFTATNLIGTGSYATDQAKLPPGLVLSAAGVLEGTPNAAGTYPGIVVSVVDAHDGSSGSTRPFTVTVRDVSTDLTADNVQSSYRIRQGSLLATPAPTALNATPPVAWALDPSSTPLPQGLTVDPATGVVSGRPSVVGITEGHRLRLSDASGRAAVQSVPFSVAVAEPLAVANVAPSYSLRLASPLDVQPTAVGKVGATTWELSGGALPQALAFDPNLGRIAGSPLVSGRIPGTAPTDAQRSVMRASITPSGQQTGYVLKVTDSFDGAVATSAPFDIVVGMGLVIVGPTSYDATVGLDFSTSGTFTVAGSKDQLTWSVATGTLPDGLTLDGQTGVISGRPTTPSISQNIRLLAEDRANGVTGTSAPFRISVSGGLAPAAPSIVYAHVGKPYAYLKPTVTGNQGPVSWSLAAGGLPPGLALDAASGEVRGAPTRAGTYTSIKLGARDGVGRVGVTDEIAFVVNDNPTWASRAIVIPNSRYEALVGPYPAPVIQGAVGKVTFSKAPPGRWSVGGSNDDFTIDPQTGVIAGKVTGKAYNGDYMYQGWVIATDEAGGVAQAPGTEIFTGLPNVQFGDCDFGNGDGTCYTKALPGIRTVVPVGYVRFAMGTVRYSFVPGLEPPDWATLDPATGIVTGTPPKAGQYTYAMRITDVDGMTADRKRGFDVVEYPHPPDTPERVTVDVRFGNWHEFNPIVPQVTAPDGGAVTWEAWGPYGFPFDTSPNGGAFKATWTGQYRYGFGVGTYSDYYVRAKAADGTVLSLTNVVVNILPPVTIGEATHVCVRHGESFDTGPRQAGNVFGTARWESWWNSSPYTGLDPFIKLDPATGRISGTAPNYNYGVYFEPRVFDSFDNASAYAGNQTRQYISVFAPLSLAPPDNVTVRERETYFAQMRSSGGNWDATMYVAGGTLPPGTYMDRNGYFGGTATQAGTYTFKVGLRPNSCGSPDRFTDVTVTVTPAGTPYATLPDTVYFRQGLLSRSPDGTVVGKGSDNYRWQVFFPLPAGLSVDAGSGAVYGITDTAGVATGLVVQAMNTRTNQGYLTNAFQAVVLPAPTLTMPETNRAVAGRAVRITPTGTGFVGPVTWSGANLPAWASIDPIDGSVVGTPLLPGTVSGLAVRATEAAVPGLDPSGNPIPPAGKTSNAFSIEVLGAPSVVGAVDLLGATDTDLSFRATAAGVSGTATWGVYGDVPAGFSLDAATGTFGGRSRVSVSANLRLVVTDSATGLTGTSPEFRVGVAAPALPARPQAWSWGDQICVYGKADGTFAGRQLQTCSGDGCTVVQRGCSAPFAGGETSYPVGLSATECQDPTLPPNDGFCPSGPGGGRWLYAPVETVPNNGSCITVTSYRLGCYLNGSTQPSADTASCGPAPTSVSECRLNDKGKGTCAPGVVYTDGTSYNGFDDGATWYGTNFCAAQPSIRWAYQWNSSGVGPDVYWGYVFQCTKDRYKADDALCGPKPEAPATCRMGTTNLNVGKSTCPPEYPRFHSYRMQGCLMGTCPYTNSSQYDTLPGGTNGVWSYFYQGVGGGDGWMNTSSIVALACVVERSTTRLQDSQCGPKPALLSPCKVGASSVGAVGGCAPDTTFVVPPPGFWN